MVYFIYIFNFCLFLCLESFYTRQTWKDLRRSRLKTHIALLMINSLLLRFIFLQPIICWINWVQKMDLGLVNYLELNTISEYIFVLLGSDLFLYGWHKINHEWNFLWRFHRVHHTDTHLDVTTSVRFHAGELILSQGFRFIWILLLGPSLSAYFFWDISVSLFSQFHHSNMRLNQTLEHFLSQIIITPRIHSFHHAVSVKTRDANYSTIFSIWDRLFKTLKILPENTVFDFGVKNNRSKYLNIWHILKEPFLYES